MKRAKKPISYIITSPRNSKKLQPPEVALYKVLSKHELTPHQRVKRLCGLYGLSLRNLASKIGVSEGHLNQVLSGLRPYMSTRRRIAEALSVPVDLLWEENV